MTTSAPNVNLTMRDAFDEGCLAVFKSRVQRPLAGWQPRDLFLRFATHYQHLSALPRHVRRTLQRRWKCTLSAIALLMALGQAPAFAATIQVSASTPPSITADGKCSLIEAIVNANGDARPHLDCVAGSGPDTIVLPAQSQQVLNAQEQLPQITSRIVIEGYGSTISRNMPTTSTFFFITQSGNLTLNRTTVTGATATSPQSGYGVFNRGRFVLNNGAIADTGNGLSNEGGVAVLTNSSVTGSANQISGIDNRAGGTLTLTNSVVSGNRASYGDGGGIRNAEGSTATLTDSIVSGNAATYYHTDGGGIYNEGTLVLIDTTVTDNEARGGAGIWNGGTATFRRSTIAGNHGRGITNSGNLTLVNSTVSNNETSGISSGQDGVVTLDSSTVTGNSLAGDPGDNTQGGGLLMYSGTLNLKRSIVSGNHADSAREIFVGSSVTVSVNDHNLFGHDGDAGVTGFTPGSTDIVPNKGIRGILLPLADNGGQTRTHALAINSPAIDASPDDDTCPTIDQREALRPRGAACDIGSFEGSAVMCSGRLTTMVGTDGPDDLTGTAGPDVIAGLNGNDTVSGLGGDDLVCAGGGADDVSGGAGNDVLFGQDGDDRLTGNGGNDALNGGVGQDACNGGPGTGDTTTACETVNTVP